MLFLLSFALFLSAFLLFSSEPMVAKMILPVLGGSAAVWTTCVVFFQIVLLAGYSYAHLLGKITRLRNQWFLHFPLMAMALLFLPIRFGVVSANASSTPYSWILWHLMISAGLPVAVVSATAPLLQNWLAKSRLVWSKDPYFLYAVSNAGSLLALAAYPSLVETRLGVRDQNVLWTYGYVLLIPLVLGCVWLLQRKSNLSGTATLASDQEAPANSPSLTDRTAWLASTFVPSALMLAVTNHISLNIGSFPFLWVLPLGLYLLTFMMAFARHVRIPTKVVSLIATITLVVLFPLATVGAPVRSNMLRLLIACHLVILFAGSLLCHSFLADRRPATKYLTEFYLMVALGGVLGGMFTAIFAPAVFSTVLEYPLLVAAIMFFRRPPEKTKPLTLWAAFDLVLFGGFVALVLFGVLSWAHIDISKVGLSATVLAPQAALILALLLFRKSPVPFATAFSILVVVYSLVLPKQFEGATRVHLARDFFGVKKVLYEPDINMLKLLHGDTLHGRESLDQKLAGAPLSYYHRTGPVGDVMELISTRPQQRVGVVGLGTGAIAAYAGATRHVSFFDVDPQVVEVANGYFSFLRRCGQDCDVQIGDGRMLLESKTDGTFDLLVLDAFSSDSIPAHLVSLDAVRMYMSKLKPDGLLMFHVSNRYLAVEKIVSSVLEADRIPGFIRQDEDDTPPGKSGSHYVVALRNPESLEGISHRDEWMPIEKDSGVRPWTDDFSDLWSILK